MNRVSTVLAGLLVVGAILMAVSPAFPGGVGAQNSSAATSVAVPLLVDGGQAIALPFLLPFSETSVATNVYREAFTAVDIVAVVADGVSVRPRLRSMTFYHMDTSTRRVRSDYVYLVKSSHTIRLTDGWCLLSGARVVDGEDKDVRVFAISKDADAVDIKYRIVLPGGQHSRELMLSLRDVKEVWTQLDTRPPQKEDE